MWSFVQLGRSAAHYASLPEAATGHGSDLLVADPARVGAVRINPRGDEDYQARFREAYYTSASADALAWHMQHLVPDLPPAFWLSDVDATAVNWGRVPRSYVRCLRDQVVAPALQARMIAEADRLAPNRPFEVLDLDSGHSPFATVPDELARVLVVSAG